jgi:hypothetical protein
VEEEEFDVYTHLLVSSFLVSGGGERGKGREGRNVGRLTSAGDEAGNVVIVKAVDALEIPGISGLVGEEEERRGGHTSVRLPTALPPRYLSCCAR